MSDEAKAWEMNNTVLKFILLIFGIISIASFPQAYASFYGDKKSAISVNEKSIIILKDKSGAYFEILPSGYIKRGVMDYSYYLKSLNDDKLVHLGGGVADGESGGCNRSEFLNIDKAVADTTLEIKKINQDSYFDIFLEYTEQDCKTSEIKKITNIFYATETGFQRAEETNE